MNSEHESARTVLRVVTRQSPLAMAQTNFVISALQKAHGVSLVCEIARMETQGDKVLDQPLPKIGGKGLFTEELETMLDNGSADIAVHSLKDLPTSLPEGLCIGAILKRENPCDVVLFRDPSLHRSLEDLPVAAVIGTSSLRRKAALMNKFPEKRFIFQDIRGNVGTRIGKLRGENKIYDAIVLAAAGLDRLHLQEEVHQSLPDASFFHAVGQASLAVECRLRDERVIALLSPLHDADTAALMTAERAMLATLQGGCHMPIAVHTELVREREEEQLHIQGVLYDAATGGIVGKGEAIGAKRDAYALGAAVAKQMGAQI